MATLAVTVVEKYGHNSDGCPISRVCADGTGISKNKVLTLSDPNTVAEVADDTNAAGYKFGGIAAMEKEASDSSTQISVLTDCLIKAYSSGAITVGVPVRSVGGGYFGAASYIDWNSGTICGYAVETSADDETVFIRIRV